MNKFDNLKVGDEVVHWSSTPGRTTRSVVKITKITAKYVSIGEGHQEKKFRKDNGMERTSDIWNKDHIDSGVEEFRKEMIEKRRALEAEFASIVGELKTLPSHVLVDMIGAFKKWKNTKGETKL